MTSDKATAEAHFDDYLLKSLSGRVPTSPQQRFSGAPQRSPSWSKMVSADEAQAAERSVAELAAAEMAAAAKVAAEITAEAERQAAPNAAKKRRSWQKASKPPPEQQPLTNAASQLGGPKRRTFSKRGSSPIEQQAAERAASEKAAVEKAVAELAAAEKAAEEAAAERHAASKAAAVGLLQPEAAVAVVIASKRSSSPIEQQFTNAASQLGGPQLAVRMTGEP